jgi:hypothetical protein
VGNEACASSHYWSRRLQALRHTVQLMPPSYVKPHVKRQKNDSTDAEAICEAVTRPNMRFVESKTIEQQSSLMLHRVRHLIIRQQTAVINSLATSAVAGAEPMPGIASGRLLVAFDRCQAIMRLSNSRICELQDLRTPGSEPSVSATDCREPQDARGQPPGTGSQLDRRRQQLIDTPAVCRTSLAVSASKAIAIWAAGSRRAHSP